MPRSRAQWTIAAILALVAALMFWDLLAEPVAGSLPAAAPPSAYDPLTERPRDERQAGELAYLRYCSGCHGVAGDGKGPAARFLTPKPRDFTRGIYKFHSCVPGAAPFDDDVLRAITRGLHGTSMPSWRLLPEHERRALVRHVKGFFTQWQYRGEPSRIPMHKNPFDLEDPEAIEAAVKDGERYYHKEMTCWSCHPGYLPAAEVEALTGVSPGPLYGPAVSKPDDWGEVIEPPDFRTDTLKSVDSLEDLYRVITAGVGGTAMPAWITIEPEKLWALAIYVDSLRPRSELRRRLAKLRQEASE
jgi:cytochrome c oxidase cbb3-type subunit 2